MTGALMIGNFLSDSLGNRGVCEDLAEGLRARGWPLITASSRAGRPARLADMLTTAWSARRRYQVAQVDVFSGPSFFWAEAVCHLLTRLGRPYVLTLHGGRLPEFAERHPSRVRRLLRSAAAVTAPSRHLTRQLNGYRRDIIFLPNSVDISRFAFRLRSNPRPKLVWLRAFHREYNPALAIETVGILAAEVPGVELVMFGADRRDGSLQQTLAAARRLGVEDCVEIREAVPFESVPRCLNGADIFLNTTDYESFGTSVVEAAACGLCIVSTSAGALPDIWTHRRDALIVPPRDAVAMACAVRKIIGEAGLAHRLSRNARRSAERFEREIIVTRWEDLLERVQQTAH